MSTTMKKGLLMAALAEAMMDKGFDAPTTSLKQDRIYHKDPLTKKQKKVRAKNKMARASRKKNRK